jgi:hypothetical protein
MSVKVTDDMSMTVDACSQDYVRPSLNIRIDPYEMFVLTLEREIGRNPGPSKRLRERDAEFQVDEGAANDSKWKVEVRIEAAMLGVAKRSFVHRSD